MQAFVTIAELYPWTDPATKSTENRRPSKGGQNALAEQRKADVHVFALGFRKVGSRNPFRWQRSCIWVTYLAFMVAIAGCPKPRVEPLVGEPTPASPEERKLWERAQKIVAALEKEKVLEPEPKLNEYLRGVAHRLLPYFRLHPGGIRSYVLKDPFLNAGSLPNGSLVFTQGLLAHLDDEAQLACVVGHELAHVSGRHALLDEQYGERARTAVGSVLGVLIVVSGGAVALPGPSVFADLLAGDNGSLLASQLRGFRKELEHEADQRGWEAVRAAGYEVRACTEVLQLLLEQEQELVADKLVREPYFYGDHPATSERLTKLTEWLQRRSDPGPSQGERRRESFQEAIASLRIQVAETNMKIRRFQRARRLIDRHLAAFPTRPDGYMALGEWYRRHPTEGNATLAAQAYRKALDLDGTFAPAHREMALLCLDQGDSECARRHLLAYLELAPSALDRPIAIKMLRELEGGTP